MMILETVGSQMDFSDWWLRHLLWNCPNMNVTELHWWSVNIDSGNGLVSSGNKPLPEPMLTDLCRHMASLGHSELKHIHHSTIRAGVKYVLSNTNTNTKIWIFQIQIQIFCSTLFQIQIQIQIHQFKYKYNYKYVQPNISAETVRIQNRVIL